MLVRFDREDLRARAYEFELGAVLFLAQPPQTEETVVAQETDPRAPGEPNDPRPVQPTADGVAFSADYRTVTDTMDDPQLAHRGAFSQVHDAGGSFKALNPPFRMSASRTAAGPRVPALGEHTREVLASLGLGAVNIAALVKG